MIKIFFPFLIFLFSSCSNNHQKLNQKLRFSSHEANFYTSLSQEYLQLSQALIDKYNWRDSDYFSIKGLNILKEKDYFPEKPENWNVPLDKIDLTKKSRDKLMRFVNNKNANNIPIKLAQIIAQYDCWISKINKKWDLEDSSKCKVAFFQKIEEISNLQKKLPQDDLVIVKKISKTRDFKKYDIDFDLNSNKISTKSRNIVADIIQYIDDSNGNFSILVVGRADRVSKKIYNQKLARERSLVVRSILVKNGVPLRSVIVRSKGDTNPLRITRKNRQNKYNRQTSVYIMKGSRKIDEFSLEYLENKIYRQNLTRTIKQY
jgi:outer membrane protein OmpA-like peptidoglycan-associated protein